MNNIMKEIEQLNIFAIGSYSGYGKSTLALQIAGKLNPENIVLFDYDCSHMFNRVVDLAQISPQKLMIINNYDISWLLNAIENEDQKIIIIDSWNSFEHKKQLIDNYQHICDMLEQSKSKLIIIDHLEKRVIPIKEEGTHRSNLGDICDNMFIINKDTDNKIKLISLLTHNGAKLYWDTDRFVSINNKEENKNDK